MERKLQFHSCLTMAQFLVLGWIQLSTLLKKRSSDVWVAALFSRHRWRSSPGVHSKWLLQPLRTVLHLGPVPQELTVPPQIKNVPLPCPMSWTSLVPWFLLLLPLVSLFSLWASSSIRSSLVSYTKLSAKSTAPCRECIKGLKHIRIFYNLNS